MITITLEGECWRDVLREMSIIEASVRGSRIEDLPDEGIVAPDEREGQGGPKKPVCAYCEEVVGRVYLVGHGGNIFCSPECAEMHTLDPRHYGLGPEERAEILERVR